jgi:hypothetical protein
MYVFVQGITSELGNVLNVMIQSCAGVTISSFLDQSI